ncbi:MAG: hypothetical protein FWF50_07880 [Defluviitaleaceae bacterium]|nr:hypothetical protein [Defluviitaleaceae bacterium]
MKTIKNLADEIGVTKQAVFKKINTEPFKTKITNHLHTIGKVINLDEEGERLVKEAFEKTSSKRASMPPKKKEKDELILTENLEKIAFLEEHIKILEAQVKTLELALEEKKELAEIFKTQLETKDRQIEEKDRQLESKDKQINNVQEQAKDTTVAILLSQQQHMQAYTKQPAQETPAPQSSNQNPYIQQPEKLISYKEDALITANPKMDWLKNLAKKKFK